MNTAASGSSHAHGSYDDAALRGASLAFRKRPSPTSTSSTPGHLTELFGTSRESNNEALTAATSSAERAKSPARTATMGSHTTGRSTPDIESQAYHYSHQAGLIAARLQQLGSPSSVSTSSTATTSTNPAAQMAMARSPMEAGKLDAKNPSLIAATLAASRSASPNPKIQTPRRVGSMGAIGTLNATIAHQDAPVDAASIPPTGSLISMFERTHTARLSPPRVVVGDMAKASGKSAVSSTKQSPPRTSTSARKPKPQANEPNRTSTRPISPPLRPVTPGEQARRPHTPPTVKRIKAGAQNSERPAANLPSCSKTETNALSSKPQGTTPPVHRQSKPNTPQSGSIHTPSRTNAAAAIPTTPKQKPGIPARSPSLRHATVKSSAGEPKPSIAKATAKLPKLDTATQQRSTSPKPRVISRSTTEVLSPKPTRITKACLRTTTPPPPIVLRPTNVTSPPSPDPKKRSLPEKAKVAPTPPMPRRSQRYVPDRSRSRPRGHSDTRTTPKPVISMYGLPIPGRNMKTASPPPPTPPPNRRDSIASAPPSPTHEVPRRRPTGTSFNGMPLSSMTNAIMAGSLASARLTPHNTGSSLPPLPRRQKSPRLLQTLRQPPQVDEEDEERYRRAHHHHRNKLHTSKHVHHEGSRKRWREKITDRERKRYEAIWASNRGLLLTNASPSASIGSGIGTDLGDCVVNIVVRDIWTRSRLPDDELEEVWDLVDRDGRGYLSRQEFVVGMWLIDQRLRGRKLPTKVSESIWSSVNGVTVLKPRGKK